MQKSKNNGSWVFVVDDDPQMSRSLSRLLQSAGYNCRTFESATDYLSASLGPFDAACLLLDIRMPVMSGTELQKRLPGTDHDMPIVFISAFGDIPTCVRTLKAGAVSFLTKPFDVKELLSAIREALQKFDATREMQIQHRSAQENFELLSRRERDVFRLVVRGMLNKQIAAELGIAEATVKIHRARIMSKMGAKSVADLVHLSTVL